jgi:large subunit ribosomal protein L32
VIYIDRPSGREYIVKIVFADRLLWVCPPRMRKGEDAVPLPKRKFSRARRDNRRAHQARSLPPRSRCSRCGQMVLPHRVCDNCGHYAGRKVLEVEGT